MPLKKAYCIFRFAYKEIHLYTNGHSIATLFYNSDVAHRLIRLNHLPLREPDLAHKYLLTALGGK